MMRAFLKPLLIAGLVMLVVVAISWAAFPAWRSQPGGFWTLLVAATVGVVAILKDGLAALKTWKELQKPEKAEPLPNSTVVTVNDGTAQVNTGTAERMVQAGTYQEIKDYHAATPPGVPFGSAIPPTRAHTFIDRGPIMDELRRRIRERQQTAIVGVGGMGGVGKTELARFLACELETTAQGEVLWLDVTDRPLADVHLRLARALGVTLPPVSEPQRDYEILCTAFRQSRVRLLVLDDIRRAFLPSLRYCLPPSPPCAVLLTSRLNLPDVPPGGMLPLDVMTPAQALALLESIPGLGEAATGEPEAAEVLVRLCGYHPLALDLAARRLLRRLKRSATPLADFNAQLHHRLQQLHEGDDRTQSLRANFDLSYVELSPLEQQRFRRLAVCAESGFAVPAAAALWETPDAEALESLEHLADASLVLPPERAAGRWRLHDLLRDYAEERLREAGEEAATYRALSSWLIALFDAHYMDDPDTAPHVPPELDNLRSAAAWAGRVGEGELLARLATQPRNWLHNVFRLWEEWQTWLETALRLGVADRQLRANVRKAMGDVQAFRDDRDAALDSYAQALTLYRAVGARVGEANVRKAMGDVQAFRKENDAALDSYAQALTLFRAVGDRLGEANVLLALGDLHRNEGALDESQSELQIAFSIYNNIGDRYSQARALYRLGDCASAMDKPSEAVELYRQAIALWQSIHLIDLADNIIVPRLQKALAQQGGGPDMDED